MNIPINVHLFAYDIVLYMEISSPEDQQLLNSCLAKINNCTKTCQMALNPKMPLHEYCMEERHFDAQLPSW